MGESDADDVAPVVGGLTVAVICAVEAKNRFRTWRDVRRGC